MNKIIKMLCALLLIGCMLNFVQVNVSATTYEEEQLQNNEISTFQPGDVLNFKGTPTITIIDRNGVVLDIQTASSITFPEYSLESANFQCWQFVRYKSVEGVITEITFRAYILPSLYTTAVNEGDSVTFYINEDDLPTPHNYIYEWIAGGKAGGWELEGSSNSTSFTITKDSPYYQDGFIVACRIRLVEGTGHFFTEEAIVSLIPVIPEKDPPIEVEPDTDPIVNSVTNQSDIMIVETGDNTQQNFYVFAFLASLAIVILHIMKREKVTKQ